MEERRFYFRQWLAGRDLAADNPAARQMVNFVYAIGDRQTGEALLVDPAWAPSEAVALLEAEDMKLSGVLATHYHPDHVGGDLMGQVQVLGITELLEEHDVPIHIQREEAPWVERVTGVGLDQLALHDSDDKVQVGSIEVQLIHTPGHTPGSQCFLVEGCLVAGDTLFLEGCGRTDLPGSNPEEMYRSLHDRLAHVASDVVLFPGHLYSPEASATMGETRRLNYVFGPQSEADWLAAFAR